MHLDSSPFVEMVSAAKIGSSKAFEMLDSIQNSIQVRLDKSLVCKLEAFLILEGTMVESCLHSYACWNSPGVSLRFKDLIHHYRND